MTTTTETTTARILGTTEDGDGCECCGRQNLKKYVVIEHHDGTVASYGTSCAAVMLTADTASVRKAAKAADDAAAAAARRERQAQAAAETARWEAWLAEHGTGTTVTERIASLGGFAAANAAFQAQA